MMVGGFLLVACSPAFCDADVPVPPPTVGLNKITATIDVETQLNWGEGPIASNVVSVNNYPCPIGTLTTLTTRGPYGFSTWVAKGHTTATTTWDTPVETIVSSGFFGGCYTRPNTNIVLVTGVPYKNRRYTFAWAGGSGTSVSPAITSTEYPVPGDCCGNGESTIYFDSVSPGSTVGRSIPGSYPSIYIDWLGAATQLMPGLLLTLTIAGVGQSPWFAVVKSGTITLTSSTGLTKSFSGPIDDVVTQINAWPVAGFGRYFDASRPSSVSTAATTADLKDWMSPPLQIRTCSTGLPLVLIGDVLAPSCCGGISTGGTFDTTKYSNNEAGLIEYLTTPWYPKTTGVYPPGPNSYFYPSDWFDSYVTNPDTSVTGTASWLKTPGSSVTTDKLYSSPILQILESYSLIATCELTSESSGCSNGSDYEYCNYAAANTFPLTQPFLDCSGNIYPANCDAAHTPPGAGGVKTPCWCVHYEQTYNYIPEDEIPLKQIMKGTLVLT